MTARERLMDHVAIATAMYPSRETRTVALLALDASAEAISIVGNEESRAAIRALRAELAKEE
jgi:hypothetical protein